MVKNSLFLKSIRDMKNAKAQFISIFIMAALSVTIVTGLDSVWKTVEDNTNIMYAATNISYMWIYVSNPTEKQMWSISRIKGVESIEKRFTLNAKSDIPGGPTLKVYAVSKVKVHWTAHTPTWKPTQQKGCHPRRKFCKKAQPRYK